MKTLHEKPLMMSGVRAVSLIRKFIFVSIFAGFAPFAASQQSWSDSAPRIMKLAKRCPLKVRDKNGEWANFKDSLPAGRNVIGAVNPRRPDLVFFQLARDSNFMFAAARTCFEGEEDWNVLAEEEKLGGMRPSSAQHAYVLGSVDWIASSASVGPSSGEGDRSSLDTRIRGACIGGGYEARSTQWFYGASGCVGLGRAQYREEGGLFEDSVMAYYASLRGTAYYDFLSLPYAFGGEVYTGFTKASFETPIVNYSITPTVSFTYGVAAAWRFYWENATITPKITLNKFRPSNLGFELQLAYLFGGR